MTTATASDRRRNMRAENCRACGVPCEAGQGYLYQDTNSRRRNRVNGRFLWFVKCEKCHSEAKTRTTVAMEKSAASHANEPVVRPWSVSQAKKWVVSQTTHDGDVAIRVDGANFSEIISGRDRINSRFTAPTGYSLEQREFAGKPLSENAASYLSELVLAIVVAVQSEEESAGEMAVAKLVDAGAVVTPYLSGHAWRVEYRGGRYTLWGCVDGKNKVTGLAQASETGRWVETTAEELIGE
jgi:hypothetical protein